jgi:hypothetical protein
MDPCSLTWVLIVDMVVEGALDVSATFVITLRPDSADRAPRRKSAVLDHSSPWNVTDGSGANTEGLHAQSGAQLSAATLTRT